MPLGSPPVSRVHPGEVLGMLALPPKLLPPELPRPLLKAQSRKTTLGVQALLQLPVPSWTSSCSARQPPAMAHEGATPTCRAEVEGGN